MFFGSKDIANQICRELELKANLLWKNRGEQLKPRILRFAEAHFNSGHKTIPNCPQGCECVICLMEDFLL
mgnify:CR=1 FL=1